jgi:hypothetical protein
MLQFNKRINDDLLKGGNVLAAIIFTLMILLATIAVILGLYGLVALLVVSLYEVLTGKDGDVDDLLLAFFWPRIILAHLWIIPRVLLEMAFFGGAEARPLS